MGFTLGGFGATVNENGLLVVNNIGQMDEFGKKLGIRKGDEVISFNNEPINASNYDRVRSDFMGSVAENQTVTMQVKREKGNEQETITLSAPATRVKITQPDKLEFEAPQKGQQKIRTAWLN
jgi:C-terminal processing protease CtpA/Prc